jgi:hypothetical protein
LRWLDAHINFKKISSSFQNLLEEMHTYICTFRDIDIHTDSKAISDAYYYFFKITKIRL